MTRAIPPDDRGLALGILMFFAILVVAALLYIMLDPALQSITDMTLAQAEHEKSRTVIQQRAQIWNYVLLFALGLAALFILSRAVYESGGL